MNNEKTQTSHLVPRERDFIIPDERKGDFEMIEHAALQGENVLMKGEPGCGKSEFVLHLAAKHQIPVVQVQCDGEMSVIDIVGGYQYNSEKKGTYWQDGVVPFGLRNNCWFLFDELNMALPEILARMHSIMDDRRHLDLKETGEIIPRSAKSALFASMNPSDTGLHHGTKPLSPPLLSRFDLVCGFDFLNPREEIRLLTKRTGITSDQAGLVVEIASKCREGFHKGELLSLLDTRILLAWAKKAVTFGLERSVRNTVVSRLPEQDAEVVTGILMNYGILKPSGNIVSELSEKLRKAG